MVYSPSNSLFNNLSPNPLLLCNNKNNKNPMKIFVERKKDFWEKCLFNLKVDLKTQSLTKPFSLSYFAFSSASCSYNSQLLSPGFSSYFYYLYAGQEATVRTGHVTTDWFQIGKGVRESCILSPFLFHLYAEYIMIWMKHKLESGLPEEILITSDMQMTPPLWQKVKN